MNKILIWLYRAIPLIFFFGGSAVLASLEADALGWIHIVFSMVLVYVVVKFENKLFPEIR